MSERHPMPAKAAVTMERVSAYAAMHGGSVMSRAMISGGDQIEWCCAAGHRWMARAYDVLFHETWCPTCAVARNRHTIDDMRRIAASRGGECVSDAYVNSRSLLTWRCSAGHAWQANAHNIASGTWCPECARSRKIKAPSIEALQHMARTRGGSCLSTMFSGNRAKLLWRCAEGHEWEARWSSIVRGYWCPVCAKDNPKISILDRAASIAREKGGTIALDMPRRGGTYPWRCKAGHVFHAHASSVVTGKWCPWCKAGTVHVDRPNAEPDTFTIRVRRMFVANERTCHAFRARRIDLSAAGYVQVATWLSLLASSGAMGRPPAGSGRTIDAFTAGTISGETCVRHLMGQDHGMIAASLDIPTGGEAGWFIACTRSYDPSEPVDAIVHLCLHERFLEPSFVLPTWRAAVLLANKWLIVPEGETLRKAVLGRFTSERVGRLIEKHMAKIRSRYL
ncbi:MAG: hypothetical protein GYA24_25175 [Candidatus Lokiarchaeota archaeon]|nr:hypothetical protein [Candidatus Lokiarchaeota archaeon]